MIPPGPRLPDDAIPDDLDLQAADYVLGAMTLEESLAFEAMARGNPDAQASIQSWQNRLAPLAETVPVASPPPELWQRLALAAGLAAPVVARPRRSVRRRSAMSRFWGNIGFWRNAAIAATAVAAGLAMYVLRPPQYGTEPMLAALTPAGAPGVTFLVRVDNEGIATVFPVGQPNAPQGYSLQLWAVMEGAPAPASLGLLSPTGQARLRVRSPAGTRLLVSLEPAGGSPTGKPTGPVVYAGQLANGT